MASRFRFKHNLALEIYCTLHKFANVLQPSCPVVRTLRAELWKLRKNCFVISNLCFFAFALRDSLQTLAPPFPIFTLEVLPLVCVTPFLWLVNFSFRFKYFPCHSFDKNMLLCSGNWAAGLKRL